MPRSRVSIAVTVGLGSVVIATSAFSQVIRNGVEFQVNAYTTAKQYASAAAAEANGDFVVAWESVDQDGSVTGVFARRFSSAGVSLAGEFQVNAYTTYGQDLPAVAADADGDFVVVWTSYGQDGDLTGVFARRFSSAGIAQATEFQVNSYTLSSQGDPTVSMGGDGGFVIAWTSIGEDSSAAGVFAKQFANNGAPVSIEISVNSYVTGAQNRPSIARNPDGGFVVAWQSEGQDGAYAGIFARRFISDGDPIGVDFQVSAYTVGFQEYPEVAANAGNFVVTWTSYADILGRGFSSTGTPLASEFRLNSYAPGVQARSTIQADVDGSFVAAWMSYAQEGAPSSWGIFARRLDSAGTPLAVDLQVNTFTDNTQRDPTVAAADGRFVVAWGSEKQDGAAYGIFAQRFVTLAVLDIDGNGSTAALTDGLLVLRFLFGFTGAALVSNAVDGACTRCDAPAIQTYLATLI